MDAQWFPGHMAKGRRAIVNELSKVDIVIVVGDARAAKRSVSGDFYQRLGKKKRIFAFNKTDLADTRSVSGFVAGFHESRQPAFFVDCMKNTGISQLRAYLKEQQKDLRFSREIRCMACGIPNVGKSSLINAIAKRSANKAENRPAVTRALKWIRVEGSFYLLDTPGILEPSFSSPEDAFALAAIGCVKNTGYDEGELVIKIIEFMQQSYPDLLAGKYKLTTVDKEAIELYEDIARSRGFLRKGGVVDEQRASQAIIADMQNGRIGKIAFDFWENNGE
ncbi:MAG: ribosome biogenesis GTPase YlqF [Eubacteriaceae bacterium]|nr:ribosome biogenesis GTPase YlqF [Eubacteriaceae bacterium]